MTEIQADQIIKALQGIHGALAIIGGVLAGIFVVSVLRIPR